MTREQRLQSGRVARLSIWNQLFRGLPVAMSDLDRLTLCGDEDCGSERAAYVTLRACAALCASARPAVRCALRIAILYWFSNVGDHRDGNALLNARRWTFHLGEAIGTHLTWDEAVASMKRKPIDFSAYLRMLEYVEEEYAWQWSLEFPGVPAWPIDVLAGNIRDTEHAKSWNYRDERGRSKGGYHD